MTIEPISSVMTVQAQNTAAARNTATKVTTEENPSEYNPANVKAADKLDQTTAVVENAQSKDQNNTSADANSEQQQQVTNEQIKKAVEKLNKNMMSHSEAVFGIHEATNRITIKIIDKDTKKVIKELPFLFGLCLFRIVHLGLLRRHQLLDNALCVHTGDQSG